ncbi:MAG: hypothetical protein GY710_10880 [Desulfobacteraceae bacterium]|nr:hypothetical protein [Desulfobacteraceae bacterium]
MDKKKIAAAMAAVTAYIKTGEAAACQNLEHSQDLSAKPVPQVNLWGITGRRELMQTNTMMQLRMFK